MTESMKHLVISRRVEQCIDVGDLCRIKVIRLSRGMVKLLFTAPAGLRITRPEANRKEPS